MQCGDFKVALKFDTILITQFYLKFGSHVRSRFLQVYLFVETSESSRVFFVTFFWIRFSGNYEN